MLQEATTSPNHGPVSPPVFRGDTTETALAPRAAALSPNSPRSRSRPSAFQRGHRGHPRSYASSRDRVCADRGGTVPSLEGLDRRWLERERGRWTMIEFETFEAAVLAGAIISVPGTMRQNPGRGGPHRLRRHGDGDGGLWRPRLPGRHPAPAWGPAGHAAGTLGASGRARGGIVPGSGDPVPPMTVDAGSPDSRSLEVRASGPGRAHRAFRRAAQVGSNGLQGESECAYRSANASRSCPAERESSSLPWNWARTGRQGESRHAFQY